MGTDVYMRWKGMTQEEKDAQITGFSTRSGHLGYLREAYHGQPYATVVLVPEGWDDNASQYDEEDGENAGWVAITAQTLRDRLDAVVAAAKERERLIHGGDEREQEAQAQAFVDFVELAERKERETGAEVEIFVSY